MNTHGERSGLYKGTLEEPYTPPSWLTSYVGDSCKKVSCTAERRWSAVFVFCLVVLTILLSGLAFECILYFVLNEFTIITFQLLARIFKAVSKKKGSYEKI